MTRHTFTLTLEKNPQEDEAELNCSLSLKTIRTQTSVSEMLTLALKRQTRHSSGKATGCAREPHRLKKPSVQSS